MDEEVTIIAMRDGRQMLLGGGLALVILSAGVCASAGSQLWPSASVTTLMAGWEQRFKLEWSPEPERGGTRRIRGYISSQHGELAPKVSLLAQGLTRGGAVVGQRIAAVPGGVPGFGRVSFVITNLPVADHYRVTVWDYTLHQSPSFP